MHDIAFADTPAGEPAKPGQPQPDGIREEPRLNELLQEGLTLSSGDTPGGLPQAPYRRKPSAPGHKSPCEIYGHEQFGVREFQRYAGMPLYCVCTGPLYGIAASGGAAVVGYATINCV